MRIGMKRKVCLKILYLRKIVALMVLVIMITVLLGGFFTNIYKPYITSQAVGRANNLLQTLVNNTVIQTLEDGQYGSFVNILRDDAQKIVGIETDVVKINEFKSLYISRISEKLKSIQNEKFGIPILAFLNNPFLSWCGPAIYINVVPIGTINADIKNSFTSVGVNQTKHQIDLYFKTDVVIIMPALEISHSVSSTVPVAQTVIVGEVPQSYTNVVASDDKLNDTVLQLAEN